MWYDLMDRLEALDKSQSKLPRYIIIGNDDPQLELYESKYDNVVIFDKEKFKKKVDSVDNFDISGTPLYARKFCYEFAKKEKIIIYDTTAAVDDGIFDLYIHWFGRHLFGCCCGQKSRKVFFFRNIDCIILFCNPFYVLRNKIS